MKKIYCKNCKWAGYYHRCKFLKLKEEYNPLTYGNKKWEYGLKYERNKNGECKDYQPKWWRKLLNIDNLILITAVIYLIVVYFKWLL